MNNAPEPATAPGSQTQPAADEKPESVPPGSATAIPSLTQAAAEAGTVANPGSAATPGTAPAGPVTPGPAAKPGAAPKAPRTAGKPGAALPTPGPAAKDEPAKSKNSLPEEPKFKKPPPSNDKFPKAFGFLAYPKVVLSIGLIQMGLGIFSTGVGFLLYFTDFLPPRPDPRLTPEKRVDFSLGYSRTCLGAGISGLLLQVTGLITLLAGLNKKPSFAEISCLLQLFLCCALLYYITYTVSTGLLNFLVGALLYIFVWVPDVYFLLALWSFSKILKDLETEELEEMGVLVTKEAQLKKRHIQVSPEVQIQKLSDGESLYSSSMSILHPDDSDTHHHRHKKRKTSHAPTVIEETVVMKRKSGAIVQKVQRLVPISELKEGHDPDQNPDGIIEQVERKPIHHHVKKPHSKADGQEHPHRHKKSQSHSNISIAPSVSSVASLAPDGTAGPGHGPSTSTLASEDVATEAGAGPSSTSEQPPPGSGPPNEPQNPS